ncbi:MAG: group II intron reverse transcriptase/maturase, partial [Actinobacteria bacterium]|nr:group II intron reverse transcriptase/maturase [Actinomycetota bacterium]
MPKGGGKFRTLSIPTIKDRVVQGALKLIIEPIFEADFKDGSYGYRPKRTTHQAIEKVATEIVRHKTMVVDMDIERYFDNVCHHILFAQVAKRINDDKIMRLLKLIVKAGGKRGVGQGAVISPLLANIYLNQVDEMLEKAKETTRLKDHALIEYARFADGMPVQAKNKWGESPLT